MMDKLNCFGCTIAAEPPDHMKTEEEDEKWRGNIASQISAIISDVTGIAGIALEMERSAILNREVHFDIGCHDVPFAFHESIRAAMAEIESFRITDDDCSLLDGDDDESWLDPAAENQKTEYEDDDTF